MKAEDFMQWLEFKSIEDSQFIFYINEINSLKNDYSITIAVRTFLKDKSDLLLQFLEETDKEITTLPNFVQFLMVYYFKEGLFSVTNYLLQYKLSKNYIEKLEKRVVIMIDSFYKNRMYESICYFIHYQKINSIIKKVKKLEYEESVKIHYNKDDSFKKLFKAVNISNF